MRNAGQQCGSSSATIATNPKRPRIFRAIYANWWLYLNFFQPIRKLVEKKRVGGKMRKKYDQAKTQYVRVLAFPDLEEKEKERLRKVYQTLAPVELRRRVEKNLTKLRRLHG